jgi:hypothetical protein
MLRVCLLTQSHTPEVSGLNMITSLHLTELILASAVGAARVTWMMSPEL